MYGTEKYCNKNIPRIFGLDSLAMRPAPVAPGMDKEVHTPILLLLLSLLRQ